MSARAATTTIGAVTGATLRAKLEAVARDMASTLSNATQSPRLSTSRAFACAVVDDQANVVALDNPLHLASAGETASHALDYYEFATSEDDVIVSNDPYGGGLAVHYLTLIAPVGFEGDIVAHVVVQIQVEDIGGVVRGGLNPRAVELWAEGIRFVPIKLVMGGRRRRDVFDTLVLNSRDPDRFRGDLEAALASLETGRKRLLELVDTNGLATFRAGMESALSYSETRLRAAISRIPPGRYQSEATLDHDGQGIADLTVRVALEVHDGRVRIDFEGTDPQSPGFVNSPPSNTIGHALLPLVSLVGGDLDAWNQGLLRPVDVNLPPGTLVNPRFPAPTGWCRGHVGYETTTAVQRALASALPGAVPVGCAPSPLAFTVKRSVRLGGVEEQESVTDLARLGQPGEPAQPRRDGWGAPGPASRSLIPSVEEFEIGSPARVVALEYAVDSGGPGQFRGGPGTETTIALSADADERLFGLLSGVRNRAPGFAGGSCGAAAWLSVAGAEPGASLPELVYDHPTGGGVEISLRVSGGGGFGLPLERPVEAVLADVRSGLVSAESARRDYGVSVDEATGAAYREAEATEAAGG